MSVDQPTGAVTVLINERESGERPYIKIILIAYAYCCYPQPEAARLVIEMCWGRISKDCRDPLS